MQANSTLQSILMIILEINFKIEDNVGHLSWNIQEYECFV